MMSQQQRKFYPCRRGCGTQVTFDNAHKSSSGKFIPLSKDPIGQLSAHQCPNKTGDQKSQQPMGGHSGSSELSKEIAAIKAQLLVLVARLDRLETKEMSK